MNNKDVKKQLEIKNKEIYQNKLNLDLDNNLEVLVLATENLLESATNNALKKTIEIKESFFHKKEIEEYIKKFIDWYRDNLMNLLELKKENIKQIILELDTEITISEKDLEDIYKKLEGTLKESSCKKIKELSSNLNDYYDSSFKQKRLETYLNDIFLFNLNDKVLDIIRTRDIMLLNTFKETYLKYIELNKNTIGN